MSLEIITAISNKYGKNPEFVLAGGGNTSYKTADTLYIKGSGTQLATITPAGFVALDRTALRAIYSRKYSNGTDEREAEVLADMMAARKPGENKRPSVETQLHDIIPTTFVLHLHPGMINGMTCGKGGKAAFERLFGDCGIWVEPIMPGYVLAMRIKGMIEEFAAKHGKNPDYILLQNHGIFTGGESEAEIDARMDKFLKKLSPEIKAKPDFSEIEFDLEKAAMTVAAIRGAAGGDAFVVLNATKQAALACADGKSFAKVYTTFSPDHMVYCGDAAAFAENDGDAAAAAITAFNSEKGRLPRIIGLAGLGYCAVAATLKEADVASAVFADAIKVSVYAESFGGGAPLPDELIYAINNWEVERYRKSVAFTGAAALRAAGKITLVTGSAQGFGKGIAEQLAENGAVVVVADLNYEGACAVASELCEAHGKGCSIGISADVSNEESVKKMVFSTVCRYGGLDALVSNAGIVRAGSLDEMTLSNFELCTKINYTAFFLCSKFSAQIMKQTRRFAPDKNADIIQINSKSGLSGSNKNFAYAGSKFGGIGLVQSFALELAPFGIKVNAVCPGNFLEGPLWMDPVKGLFVQYLAAGKVPGAKTVDDVRRFYEAKVPMGRGCRVPDVARAIFYIMEQVYETGQAIPVTGGQEMLK